MRSLLGRPVWHYLLPLAIFVGTLFVRAVLIGGPPHTDEGFYAFSGDLVWNGSRSLPIAPINLYPSLVRSVGMPADTPLLRLRIVDAFAAASAALMFYFFLTRWTALGIAFVMAASWSFASNLPLFLEAGYRNSIMAATAVYLGALCLLSSRANPFWAGVLIPLAVFLREPLFPVVIISLYLAAAVHGKRGVVNHVAGLVIAGCTLLVWLWLYRGSPLEVLSYYRVDLPMIYEGLFRVPGRNIDLERWGNLWTTLTFTRGFLPPAGLGLIWLLASGRQQWEAKGLAILLFFPALFEILTKHAVHYHWSMLLLGTTFLGAMALQWLYTVDRSPTRWLAISGFAFVAWLSGELEARYTLHMYLSGYRLSREFAPVMLMGQWDDPCINRSAYLQMAKFIRDNTTPADRIMISGGYHALYPLTGRRPISDLASDLTYMSILKFAERRPELIELVRQKPPKLVIETLRRKVDLKAFWPDFDQRYRLVHTFPQDESKHLGIAGARIWELKP